MLFVKSKTVTVVVILFTLLQNMFMDLLHCLQNVYKIAREWSYCKRNAGIVIFIWQKARVLRLCCHVNLRYEVASQIMYL